ncbi:unnamed protein product [Adineta steineri]|uniref:Uncharacterized protein n=1 Tax=Adineta steineri TaxID=433720 RepID=A0A814VVW1_9BILA|nr:unnamed protein product [Adineta steineri]
MSHILPNETKLYTANKELPFISTIDLKLNKYLYKIDVLFGNMSIIDANKDEIICYLNLDYLLSGLVISPINSSILYVRHMNIAYENNSYSIDEGFFKEINFETQHIERKIQIRKNPTKEWAG